MKAVQLFQCLSLLISPHSCLYFSYEKSTKKPSFWLGVQGDDLQVESGKVMDVEEIQTSLAQKPTILKPLQINQVVNKILQSAILPKKKSIFIVFVLVT